MSGLRLTTVLKTDLRGFPERVGLISSQELSTLLSEQAELSSQVFGRYGGQIIRGEGDWF